MNMASKVLLFIVLFFFKNIITIVISRIVADVILEKKLYELDSDWEN